MYSLVIEQFRFGHEETAVTGGQGRFVPCRDKRNHRGVRCDVKVAIAGSFTDS